MVWVWPPPVAVMVMVELPVGARLPMSMVMVDLPEPGAAMVLGLKEMLLLLPSPVADRVMAELKVPETVVVRVTLPDEPLSMVMEVGEAERVKLPVTAAVTVSETVVEWVMPSPVPVTVME